MGYCDHTDAEVFALTRQRREEARRAAFIAKYGPTRIISAPSAEYTGPCWLSDKQRREALERDFVQPDPTFARSLRRNLKKTDRNQRRAVHRAYPDKGDNLHTNFMGATTLKKLREFQGNRCYLCSEPFEANNGPTQDHVMPRAKGGRNAGNVLLAHRFCNELKGDRMPTATELAYLASIKTQFVAATQPPTAGSAQKGKQSHFRRAMFWAKCKRVFRLLFARQPKDRPRP